MSSHIEMLEVVRWLERQAPARATNFMYAMHCGHVVRCSSPDSLPDEAWIWAWGQLERHPFDSDPDLRDTVVRLVETHSVTVGTPGLVRFAHETWRELSPLARGRLLAGLATRLPWPSGLGFYPPDDDAPAWDPFLAAAFPDSELDAVSAAALACNAIRADRMDLLNSTLARADLTPRDRLRAPDRQACGARAAVGTDALAAGRHPSPRAPASLRAARARRCGARARHATLGPEPQGARMSVVTRSPSNPGPPPFQTEAFGDTVFLLDRGGPTHRMALD